MGIYLGDSGHVELLRESLNVPLYSDLDPADVNVNRKRFSFDFPHGALITGDRIEIRTRDNKNLELVAGHDFPDWDGYIGVDDAGGVALYETLQLALQNNRNAAIELIEPSYVQPIAVRNTQIRYRCIANVTNYEITTTRDTVDITTLGEEFKTQYAGGLISGQGTLNCLWQYEPGECEYEEREGLIEYPHYLAQLCIRTVQGASFQGRFYLDTSQKDAYVWYEAECIVTNVAMNFTATQPVTCSIQFVTTGKIALHMGMPPAYLLQEDGNLLLAESGEPIEIEST